METKQRNRTPGAGERSRPGSASVSGKRAGTGNSRRPSSENPTGKTGKPTQQKSVKATPDVVYLAPKPFSRNRLILRLVTVVAVVVAVLLGLSVFFKVENIYVSGAEKYTAWDVQQAAGIREGDNLLTFSRAEAAGKITESLDYVKSVRIGIKLPDTVYIEIVEVEVTYAVAATDGSWWLINSAGKVMEPTTEDAAKDHTMILGIQLEDPQSGQQASAWQQSQTQTDEEGNPIPVTVTAAERLSAACTIAELLERNGILGSVTSMDVTNLFSIELAYRQVQVLLGDTEELEVKISSMDASVEQALIYDCWIVDISDPSNILCRGSA